MTMWEDIKAIVESGADMGVLECEEVASLLADAEALLALRPFVQHETVCWVASGRYAARDCTCGLTDKLAALPAHLREQGEG